MSARNLLVRYSLFQFFFSMLFWTPIFFEFQKSIGLSDSQVFSIQTIYYLAFCFCEIPTGYLADRIGFKTSLYLGVAALVLSQMVAIGLKTYAGQLGHFLLVALARSFISGAATSYLFEYLDQNQMRIQFKEFEGVARAWTLVGRILCFGITGYLYEMYPLSPYILTLASALLAGAVLLQMPSVRARSDKNKEPTLWQGLRLVYSTPPLIFYILQGLGLFVLARILAVNLFQPILKQSHFSVGSFGLIMGVLSFFEALGAWRPQAIRKWLDDKQAVYLLNIIIALTMITFAVASTPILVLILMTILFYVCGLAYPIQRQLMNEAITNPSYRATLLSVESLIDRFVTAGAAWALEQSSRQVVENWMTSFLSWGGVVTLLFILGLKFSERFFLQPK